MRWTKEQQEIIEARGSDLLVSAAAGSGKTAVLVERIVGMITDPEHPVSVDRLMVMTFTRAAAEEMRERISAALRERLRREPDNDWLRLQKAMLPRARIATIDSICQTLIRQHYEQLEIDPAFRVANEGELRMMEADVLSALLEERYARAEEPFMALSEALSGRSDERLREAVMTLYRFIQASPWPERCLNRWEVEAQAEEAGRLSELSWMRQLFSDVHGRAEEYAELLWQAAERCAEEGGPAPYLPAVEEQRAAAEHLCEISDYGALYSFLSGLSFQRLSAVRGEKYDPELKQSVKAVCDAFREEMKALAEAYAALPEEALLLSLHGAAPQLLELFSLVREFSGRYEARRREKNIVDFNDMEHLALRLLYREEAGEMVPSALADQLAAHCAEIMIDEYQDSNQVQEALIQALSAERFGRPDVFMVGDVKQSIYRFRLAKPEIFLEKYESYHSAYTEAAGAAEEAADAGFSGREAEETHRKILLNRNFRSRREVLSAVNEVFFRLMQAKVGGIDYTREAALYPGAEFPEAENGQSFATELLLLDLSGRGEEDGDASSAELEGKLIAQRIRAMVCPEGDGVPFQISDRETGGMRPLRYGDIVILLRAPGSTAEQLIDTLAAYGVPAHTEQASGYFSALEVETMLAFLSVLDNPHQDIALAAVLKSPIGGMDDTELAGLRAAFQEKAAESGLRCGDLFSVLRAAADGHCPAPLSEKAAAFLRLLERYRLHADVLPVHRLLAEIYTETGYYAYVTAMPLGKKRRKNLDMLLSQAEQFGKTSYSGIFQFVRYIEEIRRYNTDYGEAAVASAQDDLVRITSIHKSKGLEYPVVFLAGMERRMNQSDLRESFVLDETLGVGCDYLDTEARIRYPGLKREVIRQKMRSENCGEELRVLYVAMTRAREKLILTAAVRDAEKKLEKAQLSGSLVLEHGQLAKSALLSAGSYLDFILLATEGERSAIRISVLSPAELSDAELLREQAETEGAEQLSLLDRREVIDAAFLQELSERISAKYPWEEDTRLRPKKTVSELKREAQGKEKTETALPDGSGQTEKEDAEVPMGKDLQEAVFSAYAEQEAVPAVRSRLSAATERGNAYHRVFQLLSYSAEPEEEHAAEGSGSAGGRKKSPAEAEISAMLSGGRLSREEAALVETAAIDRFLGSPLGKRMAKAKEAGTLRCEQRFMIGLPARELSSDTDSESLQLLQGMIDAYFEREDGALVLVDYKTDRPGGRSREETAALLRERYGLQLSLYGRALSQLTEKPVAEVWIYSTALSEALRM